LEFIALNCPICPYTENFRDIEDNRDIGDDRDNWDNELVIFLIVLDFGGAIVLGQ
jgi:hypothetical protein